MKRIKQRVTQIVSLLLVVSLLTGLLPQSVYAQKGGAKPETTETIYRGNGYEVKAAITAAWGTYANIDVTIKNKSLKKLEDWQLLLETDVTIENIWNASIAQKTETGYLLQGAGWNNSIGLFGSVSFGATVSRETGAVSLPADCSLLGEEQQKETEADPDDEESGTSLETTGESDAESGTAAESESSSGSDPAAESEADSGPASGITDPANESSRLPFDVKEEWEGLHYAVFAGSSDGLMMNANEAYIKGDAHTNGHFTYNGTKLGISGLLRAGKTITLRTSSTKGSLETGERTESAPSLPMPDITAVLYEKVKEKAVPEDVTFGQEAIKAADDLATEGSLQINGTSFYGEGIVYAGNHITFNVAEAATPDDGARLFLCAENGNITLNGSSFALNATLYAPNGCVTINANEVTLNGRIIADRICFNGTYLNVTAGEHDFDVIRDLVAPEAELSLNVSGNTKENRKVSLAVTEEGNAAVLKTADVDWTIQKSGSTEALEEAGSGVQAQKGCVSIDPATETAQTKDLLFHQAGTYTVTALVKAEGTEYELTKEVVIEQDRVPLAGFELENDLYGRDSDGNAEIQLQDTSVSPDGDTIESRIWEVIHDANDDGIFDEKPQIISNGNETEVTFVTNRVGRHKVSLTVQEHFTDTIPSLLPEGAYQMGDTAERTESGCIFEVTNEAPEVSFDLKKERAADIVLTVGTAKEEDIRLANAKLEELRQTLEENRISARIQTVKTSLVTAKDQFAWTEYDHYDFTELYGITYPKHIIFEGDDVRMLGYTVNPMKDFLYIPSEDAGSKLFEFDIHKAETNWHSINGGGFLFNTTIDEENDTIEGFCFLVTQNYLQIIKINKTSLKDFRDGKKGQLSSYGSILKSISYKENGEEHNIKLSVNKNQVMIWVDNALLLTDFVIQNEGFGHGFGPIVSHAHHSCNLQADFTFRNMSVQTVEGEQLGDAIAGYKWREGAEKYVLHVSDSTIPELSSDENLGDTAKALLENETIFIGIGNETNEGGFKKLLNLSEQGGITVSQNELEQSMQEVNDYILTRSLNVGTRIGDYLSTEDRISYETEYRDPENDPLGRLKWSYECDRSLFAETNGQTETIIRDENHPLTQFVQTGAYVVRAEALDDPNARKAYEEEDSSVSQNEVTLSGNEGVTEEPETEEPDTKDLFGKWSGIYEYPRAILVQTRPEASLSTQVYKAKNNYKVCSILPEADAVDPDHQEDADKGIIQESFAYREVNDSAWTQKKTADYLPIGGTYLMKYQVMDKEKSISRPAVEVIKTKELKEYEKPVDTTKPDITLTISADQINLGDTVDITAFAEDAYGIGNFSLYVAGKRVTETQGIYTYCPEKTGKYKVQAFATDTFGNNFSKECYITVTDVDFTAPQIEIGSINEEEDNINLTIIKGSITDDKELKNYTVSYRKENEEDYILLLEKEEEVTNDILASVDTTEWEDGIYEFLIRAEDTTGNSMSYSFYMTLETTTIEGEQRIWLDDLLLNEETNQIELYGSVVLKNEQETATYRCYEKDTKETIEIIPSGTENGMLAHMDAEKLTTGSYLMLVTVTDDAGNTCAGTVSFTFTQGSEGNNNGVVTLPKDKDPGGENPGGENPGGENPGGENPGGEDPGGEAPGEAAGLSMQLSRKQAETGKDVIIRIEATGSISENSLQVTAGESEVPIENGKGTFTSQTAGDVPVRAEVYTKKGQLLSADAVCRFVDPADTVLPTVKFREETEEENPDRILTEPKKLYGTVTDDVGIASYRLEYRLKGEKDYLLFAEGTKEKEDEYLGTLDTTLLLNGVYEVRLTGEDIGGNSRRITRSYTVEGNLKVGNMAIGFTDLKTKLPFGDISINRLYDSRNKTNGDFGYGWSLGLAGMTIRETADMSEGYAVNSKGSGLSKVYQAYETKNHDVVVAYGDGTSDRFSVTISPETRRWLPIDEVEIGFVCDTNPRLKLEIAGDNSALIGNGFLVWNDTGSLSYLLTTEDNTKVYLNPKTGITKTIDASGNTMTYTKNGFTYEDGRGVTFARDGQGRIKNITDSNGETLAYTYDTDGDLVSFTNQYGDTVTYTYDTAHNLVRIVDPSGIAVSRYEYDENGRLIAVIDADGNRIEYDHDLDNRTEAVRDRLGNITVYTYDDNGNVLSETDPEGNTTKSTYDEHNNVTSKTDALGHTTTYAYDENNNVTKVTDAAGNETANAYDKKNLLVSMKNLDDTELLLDYNEIGLLTSTIDPDGNETNYDFNNNGKLTGISDELGKTAVYTYDTNGNVTKSTDGEGNEKSYTYDANGNCTRMRTINKTGNGTQTKLQDITYTYDSSDRLIQTRDANARITKTTYDEKGQISTNTDPDGRVTTYAHTTTGELSEVTYYDGTKESFTYDAEGNVLTRTDRLGNTVSCTYDKAGNLTTETDALGNQTTYEYDAAYRLVRKVTPTGITADYTYNTLGANTKITYSTGESIRYEYDAYSNLTAMTDAKGNTTKYEYDNLGRRTKVITPDGAVITTAYDSRGRITKQTDAEGNKAEYEYDNNDNLKKLTDSLGNETDYFYNGNGELLAVTDAKGNKTTYEYDASGELSKITRPDGKYLQYVYDFRGNLTYIYNYDRTNLYYYYKNNKLSQVRKGTHFIDYTYDAYSRVSTIKEKQGTTAYDSTAYAYDAYGRIAQRQTAVGENINYTYDEYSRLNGVETKAGKTAYAYDAHNRLVAVTDEEGNETTYAYDVNGNRIQQQNPDGTTIAYEYDAANRLVRERIKNKNDKTLADYLYTYNKNGQKVKKEETTYVPENKGDSKVVSGNQLQETGTEQKDSKQTIVTDYEYDAINRLTKEVTTNDDGTTNRTAYQYDEVGNRIRKTENGVITEYTYNNLNQLTEEVTGDFIQAYAYDVNGNLICKGTETDYTTYTYNVANELEKAVHLVDGVEQVESYAYDGEGNRFSKTETKKQPDTVDEKGKTVVGETIETDTTYFVVDTLNDYAQVSLELDVDKQLKTSYIRGDGLISQKQYKREGGKEESKQTEGINTEIETRYYLSDGHGDVRLLTDEEGNITDSYRYNAWGELEEKTGTTENPYLYTGEYYDEGTGFYYLRARYMNPQTGSFISMDTYQGNAYDPASLHKYTYAQNNPEMFHDPSGHMAMSMSSMSMGITMNQICSNVLRNLASMKLAITALSNAAMIGMTVVCGTVLTDYLVKNYLSQVGAAAPFYGTLIIAVLYEIEPIYNLQGLGTLEAGEIVEIVTLIICGAVGNKKESAVNCSLAALIFVDICTAVGVNCEIEISGKKGRVVIETASSGKSTDDKGVNNSGGGSSGGSNNNWNHRDKYLKIAQNSVLANAISELYRKNAFIGDGGTAAALINEFNSGVALKHLIKAQGMTKYLQRILTEQPLSPEEISLVYKLLDDLYNAIKIVTR